MHPKEAHIRNVRIERFYATLLQALYRRTYPLEAEFARSADPVPPDQRNKLTYLPIMEGERWGRSWESAWFRLRTAVPRQFAGKELCLYLDMGGEAMLFDAKGVPVYSFSDSSVFESGYFHDRYLLPKTCKAGEKLEFTVEAAANSLFGVDDSDASGGGDAGSFGVVRMMRLAVFDRALWAFKLDFETLISLSNGLDDADYRQHQIRLALEEAIRIFGSDSGQAAAAREPLQKILAHPALASALTVFGVGHAHIDVGWLWPVRETRRKAARTFARQLELIRKYPEYRFGASQAQLYAFIKEDYPELFQRIKRAVKAGQWELQGGMWVEADANVISGESMIRQFLHGKNFFMDEFGVEVKNLWLPDVFGYSAKMPQIIRGAGCGTFLTQKISWSQINTFPYRTFRWKGIDGTEVLTHFPPEDTYNSFLHPRELMKAQDTVSEAGVLDSFLSLFGIGDGGGGPTEEIIERGRRLRDLEGCPKFRFGTAEEFFAEAHKVFDKLPCWEGELYLELHRGTLTSQGRNKRANRKCEQLLCGLEFLASCGDLAKYPAAELDRLWKTVLLNQFHDILPGSAIREVYTVSDREYADALKQIRELTENCSKRLFRTAKDAAVLVNTSGYPMALPVDLPPEWGKFGAEDAAGKPLPAQWERDHAVIAATIPPMSFVTICKGKNLRSKALPDAGKLVLENDLIRYELAPDATVLSAYDKVLEREVLSAPGNVLSLYVDKPIKYDAWDVDIYYPEQDAEHPVPAAPPEFSAAGPVRCSIDFTLKIGRSYLHQRVTLAANSRELDFSTTVSWQERHRMLRTSFPVTVHAPEVGFDLQYGSIRRPTNDNTSWERAKFEVCGHRYADLSNGSYGVALLNDCKYGYRVKGAVLDLNLLRSSTHPDYNADQGLHYFTYALLPHTGDLAHSDVMERAAALNRKPFIAPESIPAKALIPVQWEGNGVVLEVLKKAEKEDALIVRLVEQTGADSSGVLRIAGPRMKLRETDLMEWNDGKPIPLQNGCVELKFRPFQIRTFKLKRR